MCVLSRKSSSFRFGGRAADSRRVVASRRRMIRGEATVVWIQLLRQVSELTVVARIFKQDDILHVRTDRPHVLVLVEKVLHGNVRHACRRPRSSCRRRQRARR